MNRRQRMVSFMQLCVTNLSNSQNCHKDVHPCSLRGWPSAHTPAQTPAPPPPTQPSSPPIRPQLCFAKFDIFARDLKISTMFEKGRGGWGCILERTVEFLGFFRSEILHGVFDFSVRKVVRGPEILLHVAILRRAGRGGSRGGEFPVERDKCSEGSPES